MSPRRAERRADNELCLPGTKCSLCPPQRPRPAASAAVRVINRRVKRWTPGGPAGTPRVSVRVLQMKEPHVFYITPEVRVTGLLLRSSFSPGFDGDSASCGVAVVAVPGGVCGQRATGKLQGTERAAGRGRSSFDSTTGLLTCKKCCREAFFYSHRFS
ncbi:hypothetical protein Q5P01_004896 [Channa striata]|uniref:Uncharacterized protein n=1 Tax=Channa striata TaxID=64152 RepID=A0AA88NF46_CHASR|nr:hypothetical protein Q5P01_004896 [Channa striata]